MTVKCLSALDKGYIGDAFSAKVQNLSELAITFKCSRRTIIRTLEEQGIDPGVRKRKPKTTTPVPVRRWYQRFADSVNKMGRSIGLTA